ncbi:MAG: hypothetical protein AAF764_06485 [Pseudomonadota bacterium]
MAGFEDLIRGALDKQGKPDAQRREAIYASSRTALERMLAQNDKLDAAAIALQKERLETAIKAIEADYSKRDAEAAVAATPTPPPPLAVPPEAAAAVPKAEAPAQALPQSTPQPPAPAPPPEARPAPAPPKVAAETLNTRAASDVPDISVTPPTRADLAADNRPPMPRSATIDRLEPEVPATFVSGQEQSVDVPDDEPVAIPPDYRGNALRERKPYAKMLLWTIILVGLGVAGWWAYTFGPGLLREQLDGSVPNPRATLEQGAFDPGTQEGWVLVFDPASDGDAIDTNNQGRAELFQSNNGMYARLTSNAGGSSNRVRLRVPAGVLEPLRGKAATIEVMARNPDGGNQQFALFCQFGAMGECGRKRFEASGKVEAYLFEMLVNDMVPPADETAWLAINTDLGGNGAPLDIYSVRMRPGT